MIKFSKSKHNKSKVRMNRNKAISIMPGKSPRHLNIYIPVKKINRIRKALWFKEEVDREIISFFFVKISFRKKEKLVKSQGSKHIL